MTEDVIGALESALRKSTAEAAINGRDFKKASADWEEERAALQKQLEELHLQLDRLVEERWSLRDQVKLYKEMNARYVHLARFVLYCAIHSSPEDDILDLRPEDFILGYNGFQGGDKFDSFIAKLAVALGLLKDLE